jgi:uncharacterized membrane protein YcaP (DUF421 family)
MAHNLYKDSPKMARDEKSGKMTVTKPKKEESKKEKGGKDGESKSATSEVGKRHEEDLKDTNARHMREREEMNKRHEDEIKSMNTKHQKEAGATSGSNDVGEPIKEIEKGAKS